MENDASRLNLRVFNPTRLVQRFFSFNANDVKFTSVMLAIWLVCVTTWPDQSSPITWGLVAMWALLMLKYNPDDRAYYNPVQELRSLGMRRKRGIRWLAPSEKTRDGTRGYQVLHRVTARWTSELIPLEVNFLKGLEEIGIIHNFRNHTDSVVIIGDGSDMSTLSLEGQYGRLQMHADGTILVAGRPDVQVGISYVFRRDPFNSWKFLDDLAEKGAPQVFAPTYLGLPYESLSGLPEDDQRRMGIHSNMVEVQEIFQSLGADIVMAAVVTIRRYGLLAQLSKQKRRPKRSRRERRKPDDHQSRVEASLESLPINDVAHACLESLLANGVGGARIMSPRECERFLRGAWDVADRVEYDDQEHEGSLEPYSHWPKRRIQVTRKASIFDHTAHAVIRVRKLPAPVLPHFMRVLHSTGLDFPAISLVGETVNSLGDYLALGRVRLISEALAEVVGFNKGRKSEQALDTLDQRQEQVSDTKFIYLYNILIDIRIPVDGTDPHQMKEDLRELARLVRRVRKDLRSKYQIETRQIKLESRQEAAMWSATAGTNML